MLLEALEDYERKHEAVYEPISFGDIGTYLQNKRAKLQLQAEAVQAESDTLRGCAIYVNGRTDPPYAELRRLILLHGGRFVPYLDAKRDVTHVVTTDLTPQKRREFQALRVVRPAWVVDSCRLRAPQPCAAYALETHDMITTFYAHSRLHHLSLWKQELQAWVAEQEHDTAPCDDAPRTIVHVDFDSFFVSVSLRDKPAWKEEPVVVCHGTSATSTSDVASCNYVARRFGVRNGMSLQRAQALCPGVRTLPYAFEAYRATSRQFYEALVHVADAIQVVSVDEALLDMSHVLPALLRGEGGPLADRFGAHRHLGVAALGEALRDLIRSATQCEASVGIGANILQARLATRLAKPSGTHVLDVACLRSMDVQDLWGVGAGLRERCEAWLGTTCIGEILARTTEAQMQQHLGPKLGASLWRKCHGLDTDVLQHARVPRSVGAHVTWGVRLGTHADVAQFVRGVCEEVMRRASARGMHAAQHVHIQVMERIAGAGEPPKYLGHGPCHHRHRSVRQHVPDAATLTAAVQALLAPLAIPPVDVRGLSVTLSEPVTSPARPSPASSPRKPRRPTRPIPRSGRALPAYVMSEAPAPQDVFHVPSSSQVDPEVVADLPPAMQEHVAHVLSERRAGPRQTRLSAYVSPPKSRSPARSASRAAARRHAAESAYVHEARIQAAAGQAAPPAPLGAPAGLEPRASLLTCPSRPASVLHAGLPLDTLRVRLSQWIEACAEPQQGDVERVFAVLCACVDARALVKVSGALQWLDALVRGASDAWHAAHLTIRTSIHAYVAQTCQGALL